MPDKMPLSVESRRALLQREINRYVAQGYYVANQTDTTAQLIKPKSFGCMMVVLSLFTLGVALILYLMSRDGQIYLTVDDDGKIHRH